MFWFFSKDLELLSGTPAWVIVESVRSLKKSYPELCSSFYPVTLNHLPRTISKSSFSRVRQMRCESSPLLYKSKRPLNPPLLPYCKETPIAAMSCLRPTGLTPAVAVAIAAIVRYSSGLQLALAAVRADYL